MQWPDVHMERRKKLAEGSKSLFVFTGSDETGHLVEPRAAWERMLARSTALGLVEALAPLAEKHGLHLKHYEMRDLHIHDLRRTLGSCLASSGTSLPIIGKVLNHKSLEATKVYARLMVTPVRNAMEEATSAMRKAGELGGRSPSFD